MYGVGRAADLLIGSEALRAACRSANAANELGYKRAEPSGRQAPTRYILTDDDGDAFSNMDFYYDERLWEEEKLDRR